MKKYTLIVIVLLCLSLFGCSKQEKIELKSGIYVFENSGMQVDPVLTLDTKCQTFEFSYSSFFSTAFKGEYSIENDKLLATTYDNENSYVFKIIDENTLAFGKSFLVSKQEKITIQEDTKFVYVDEEHLKELEAKVHHLLEETGVFNDYISSVISYAMKTLGHNRYFVGFQPNITIRENQINIIIPNLSYDTRSSIGPCSYPYHLMLKIQLKENKEDVEVDYLYRFYKFGSYIAPSSTFSNDTFLVDFIQTRGSDGQNELIFYDSADSNGYYPVVLDHTKYKVLVNDPNSPYYQKTLPDKGKKNTSIYNIGNTLVIESEWFEEKMDGLIKQLTELLKESSSENH